MGILVVSWALDFPREGALWTEGLFLHPPYGEIFQQFFRSSRATVEGPTLTIHQR